MALSSEFVSAGAPGNPWKQPCFALWSNNGSYGGVSYVDHNLQTMARQQYNDSNYGSVSMRGNGAPEMTDNWCGSDYTLTNNVPSSNSEYTNAQFLGYLGHICFNAGWYDKGNAGIEVVGSSGYQSYRSVGMRDNCVIVNDIDQDYAIWIQNDRFKVGPRSLDWYAYHYHSVNGQYISVSVKNSGYTNTRYGTGCYNAKTNKFAILESNGGYVWKPTVYNNVPGLRYYSKNMYRDQADSYSAYATATTGALYDHFANSANYTTSYAATTGKPRNNSGEDNYRCIPVLCDNGKIVMYQMIPNGNPNAWIHRWNTDGSSEGNLRQWSGTTSYGLDSGDRFGARWQVTSDGRFVIAYSPYYYYGAGQHVAIIRVSDGKFIWDQTNDTTYGYFFAPRGKSDFICMQNVNTDGGSGLYVQPINVEQLMNQTADGQQANIYRSMITQLISSNYNSTDYPLLIPIQYDTRAFNTDY